MTIEELESLSVRLTAGTDEVATRVAEFLQNPTLPSRSWLINTLASYQMRREEFDRAKYQYEDEEKSKAVERVKILEAALREIRVGTLSEQMRGIANTALATAFHNPDA